MGTCVCVTESLHLKLSQHGLMAILQYKIKTFNKRKKETETPAQHPSSSSFVHLTKLPFKVINSELYNHIAAIIAGTDFCFWLFPLSLIS